MNTTSTPSAQAGDSSSDKRARVSGEPASSRAPEPSSEHASAGTTGQSSERASSGATGPSSDSTSAGASARASQWPLWEVFVRSKAGLDHKHCGSLHAVDGAMALQLARDVYTRRQEGTSVWVVRSDQIVASDPRDKAMLFDPADDKIYRHPTFYALPDSVNHM